MCKTCVGLFCYLVNLSKSAICVQLKFGEEATRLRPLEVQTGIAWQVTFAHSDKKVCRWTDKRSKWAECSDTQPAMKSDMNPLILFCSHCLHTYMIILWHTCKNQTKPNQNRTVAKFAALTRTRRRPAQWRRAFPARSCSLCSTPPSCHGQRQTRESIQQDTRALLPANCLITLWELAKA